MPKRNIPASGKSRTGIRSGPSVGGCFGGFASLTAAATPDPGSSTMHRLSDLYAAIAREPVPEVLAALVKRLSG
jgi:hypothetical protein